ncbi:MULTISPECIES: exodeoxyribonuclease VII small subunit [Prochlorococcus]|uniref:Exodeoxyribonuclease 7 small subunit n=1 Tax=Prochlorococcus marinus (strain SARG / CCMP1375 / SS120) TaxID=167539 RepID=Q7VEA1_PROMA|nr:MULTISPECIES: exodeoxyribonuclease VII small subunit [Prochlorococcus]AAP99158.1 Exodeoxyribonuclease VII small subunit [Prochlorococcus marinus subsp. marinus str. CCMP1375]KGG11572.1 Exodeoxyribonuclease VII small subunit [Prochlorococcus marinus str. LG]KGG18474.1 Exodeoxyribonuclease VII small subunit [Prochlorococcus marinus str. SS2]KGG22747.1 Exodeoxyribonuclease VII small subunit [Prochlorococcus marinus str. SS35]KGG32623.1 Exodeoxyribonuclease VII small subunit [Prochlorococcus ma
MIKKDQDSNNNKLFNQDKVKDLSSVINKLSYEDSLKQLDDILNKLQNESLLVEDLQENYLKAKLYLKHCEQLLDKVEQEIHEIIPSEIDEIANN